MLFKIIVIVNFWNKIFEKSSLLKKNEFRYRKQVSYVQTLFQLHIGSFHMVVYLIDQLEIGEFNGEGRRNVQRLVATVWDGWIGLGKSTSLGCVGISVRQIAKVVGGWVETIALAVRVSCWCRSACQNGVRARGHLRR